MFWAEFLCSNFCIFLRNCLPFNHSSLSPLTRSHSTLIGQTDIEEVQKDGQTDGNCVGTLEDDSLYIALTTGRRRKRKLLSNVTKWNPRRSDYLYPSFLLTPKLRPAETRLFFLTVHSYFFSNLFSLAHSHVLIQARLIGSATCSSSSFFILDNLSLVFLNCRWEYLFFHSVI